MTDERDKAQAEESRKSLATRTEHSSHLPSTNLLEQALQQLTDEQKQELTRKASEEALKLQAKQADIAIQENAARRDTLDHIDAFNSLDKRATLASHKVTSEIKTGVGTRRIESRSGPTCFVVSATYGNANAPIVKFFRGYRDAVLITRPTGRRFIVWYYRTGPRLAAFIVRHQLARRIVRLLLFPVAAICWMHWGLVSATRVQQSRK
jgi:hypothetical protein